MKYLYKTFILLVLLAIGAGIFLWWRSSKADSASLDIEPARIVDIRPMVKLCNVEILEDIPVKGKVGSKHIFARQTLSGSISFDLESLNEEWREDTLIVSLPKEKVEVYEATTPDSYKVLDTWNDRLLGSTNLTTAEENAIKEEAKRIWIAKLYGRGVINMARKDAVEKLRKILPPLTGGKTVVVIDTIPPASLRLHN